MDSKTTSFKILMFPWLAHGHIFPYLELAKRILNKRKKFHIYLCTTHINFTSINQFIHKNSLQNSIELIQLHLQPSPQLPPHYLTTKNLPSHLIFTLLKAFQTAKPSFSDIINNLKPDLVIYDIFQPWAAKMALSLNIPAVHFSPFGAAKVSYLHHRFTCPDDDFPFPEICLKEHETKTMNILFEFLYEDVFDHDKNVLFVNFKLSSEIVMLKTSRGLEGKYIDYLNAACDEKILAVGPLVTGVSENSHENSDVMKWLNTKTIHSTVYISFGSECFLSKQQIHEIAKGLETHHDVNFIWVIRFPDEENNINIEEALPEGFLDRVKNRGLVVSEWVPQANILAHGNIGAFISHCGSSSLIESMYFGVPVIAMPMILAMFVDARMLVVAGACLEVKREENGVYKGEEIAKVINKVIVDKSGEGLRERAREMSAEMRIEEEQAMDVTVEELWQLCSKSKSKK